MSRFSRSLNDLVFHLDRFCLANVEAVYIRKFWLPHSTNLDKVYVWLVTPLFGFIVGLLAHLFVLPKPDSYTFVSTAALAAFLLVQFLYLAFAYVEALGDRRRAQCIIDSKQDPEAQVIGYITYSKIAYNEYSKFVYIRWLALGTLILSLVVLPIYLWTMALAIFVATMTFSYLMSFHLPMLWTNGYDWLEKYPEISIVDKHPLTELLPKMHNAYRRWLRKEI